MLKVNIANSLTNTCSNTCSKQQEKLLKHFLKELADKLMTDFSSLRVFADFRRYRVHRLTYQLYRHFQTEIRKDGQVGVIHQRPPMLSSCSRVQIRGVLRCIFIDETIMPSSRMRTVRCSGRLLGAAAREGVSVRGVCLLSGVHLPSCG